MTKSLTQVKANRLSSEQIEQHRQQREQAEQTRRITELLQASKIDDRHRDANRAEFPCHENWEQALQKCKTIVANPTGGIVLLLGDRGNGKTQCAVEAIKATCQLLRSCLYLRAREINNIMLDMQDNHQREQAIDKFVRPFLLVLDETQEKFDTNFATRSLSLIIDKRYGAKKSTIMIANCNEQQIKGILGPSIIDRIKEGGGAIVFDWPSFRIKSNDKTVVLQNVIGQGA